MQLKKISYSSAIVFGVMALIMYLVMGAFQLIVVNTALSQLPTEYQTVAGAVTPLSMLVILPIVGGIIVYIFALVAILIYNWVAMKFPITWEIKK